MQIQFILNESRANTKYRLKNIYRSNTLFWCFRSTRIKFTKNKKKDIY